MSMPNLDKRLQVLIDEQRLRRVQETAGREGVPVGQWVRDLIDEKLGTESQGEKIRAFLEYVESVGPLFDEDFDAVAEVRAARNSRVDRLLELYDESEGDGRPA